MAKNVPHFVLQFRCRTASRTAGTAHRAQYGTPTTREVRSVPGPAPLTWLYLLFPALLEVEAGVREVQRGLPWTRSVLLAHRRQREVLF